MTEESICMLCKSEANKFKYIDLEYSKGSNVPLRTVLENALNHKMKLEENSCVCLTCASLLNKLDVAAITCETVKKTVWEYCGFSDYVNNNMINAYSQTEAQLLENVETSSNDLDTTYDFGCNNYEPENVALDNNSKCNVCTIFLDSEQSELIYEEDLYEKTSNTTIVSENKLEDSQFSDDSERSGVEHTTNENTSRPYYKCLKCSKVWRIKKNLEKHMVTHHVNYQPYICEICGQAYKRLNDLNTHIGRHKGVRPFTCLYCEKSFIKKAALKSHLPIHTGETRYQCDTCGKRFIHHSSLRVHKLLHTGHKSYKCLECGLALFSKSHYNRHMRVHTGEKKYKCKFCSKAFAERYNLVSHQKIHKSSDSLESKSSKT